MQAIHLLGEIGKKAEEKYEEWEHKRMRAFHEAGEHRRKAYAEEQERHQAEEWEHEQQMQIMFMTFMRKMLLVGGQGYPLVQRYPLPTPPSAACCQPIDRTASTYLPLYPLSADGDAPSGALISPQSYYEPSPWLVA